MEQVGVHIGEQETSSQPKLPLNFWVLRPLKGKPMSCYLRIFSRQQASMLGVLTWAERKRESIPTVFCRAMELIRMIHEALETLKLMEKEEYDGFCD